MLWLSQMCCVTCSTEWIFCHHFFTLKFFQNCMNFFLLLNTKVFWRMLVTPLTCTVFFSPILWKSVGPVNCLVTRILKNIFCHTHLEQLKGKVNNIRIFIFEFSQMNYTKHILLWRWIVYLYWMSKLLGLGDLVGCKLYYHKGTMLYVSEWMDELFTC